MSPASRPTFLIEFSLAALSFKTVGYLLVAISFQAAGRERTALLFLLVSALSGVALATCVMLERWILLHALKETARDA